MVEIDSITNKFAFLSAFKPDGFKKLEVVQREIRLNAISCRYMAEWAITNQLLISSGEKGYYKLSDKGVKWKTIASELKQSGALTLLEQLFTMSEKRRLGKDRKKKRKTKEETTNQSDKACPPGGCIVLPSKHT